MQIVAKFNFDEQGIISACGLNQEGLAQQVIDNECIRLMADYIPYRDGALTQSLRLNSVIGSGKLVQKTPYARYLYYGELFVDAKTGKGCFYDAKTGRMWSRPNVSKIPSGKPLNYNQTVHSKAGSHWFDRMKAEHLQDIGEAVAKATGGNFKK